MKQAYGQPALIDALGNTHVLQSAVELDRGAAYKERFLQDLIFAHPECLPVGEIEPGFGAVVSVCTELPIAAGYIDNFLMTTDGDFVVVEAKLWRNQQSRREVVVQALDYASCLFQMDYSALEAAVLKASFGKKPRPERLHDLFDAPDAKSETDFVDAVNKNLRRGRALILVVGDGIRTEAAQLAALVQSHAGAHFTFALVELRVFEMPGAAGLLVCPRTLAQTEMISRAIVQIEDRRTTVVAPDETSITRPQRLPETITAEKFYETMANIEAAIPGKLRTFLARLVPLGVNADFQRSLNLKWERPSGKAVNLGYITPQGQVWTDVASSSVPEPWAKELAHRYVEQLAAKWGMTVDRVKLGGNWSVRDQEGHAPRVENVADKFDLWFDAIQDFLKQIRSHSAEEDV